MAKPQHANPKIYLSGGIVLGFLGVLDGLAVLLDGVSHDLRQAFSLLEVLWFLVTLYFFVAFKAQGLSLTLPSLYLAYTLYGLIVGIFLLSGASTSEVLSLPLWYVLSATLFGFVYCSVSAYLYWQWYLYRY